MAARVTVKIAFSFQDREGQTGLLTAYLPFAASDAECETFANEFIDKAGVLSDANIIAYRYTWQWATDSDAIAAVGSNVRRSLCLFYRNDDRYEAIYLPSADMSLTASSDRYDGIRVDYSNPTTAALIDAFTAAMMQTVTPEGLPWPELYVVGGVRI